MRRLALVEEWSHPLVLPHLPNDHFVIVPARPTPFVAAEEHSFLRASSNRTSSSRMPPFSPLGGALMR